MPTGHARVYWILSLARSGSSVAAYGAAAPWQVPIADEVFGPWDRTGEPYNYPPEQVTLKELFWNEGEHLTPEVLTLADTVFDTIAGEAGRVVMKQPHTMILPDEFDREFTNHPERHHRSVYLLRHPLTRLNSLYARKWFGAIGENHDLDRFKVAAERWLAHPHRLRYEDLKADPRRFFSRIWDAWEWSYTEDDVDKAIAYQQSHYHANSARLGQRKPGEELSEREWALPQEAVDLYLSDPFIREVMAEAGWRDDVVPSQPAPESEADSPR